MPMQSIECDVLQIAVLTTHHVVISSATIMSSFKTSAVKDMATILRNSFSKSTKDMIMMADPRKYEDWSFVDEMYTYLGIC